MFVATLAMAFAVVACFSGGQASGRAPEFGGHELKLSSNSDQFALFAFTFGAYDEGP